jgi:RNA polymerase sigma-70 factor (ECF subfamily)
VLVHTDEDLALGVQRGNADYLAVLVERHHSPLLGYLYRMTGGDRLLAEDLVQEAFLRVLRSIGQYQYGRPFKPWLYAIATNLARDHYKRAETRYTLSETGEEPAGGRAVGPEERVLADEQARQVAAAVMALPTHQRETVVLRYYQSLSLSEIADALGVPLGTVKSRLHLGLRRLRAALE